MANNSIMPKVYPWREKILRGKYGVKFVWRKRLATGGRMQITHQNPYGHEVIEQRVKLGLGELNPKSST